MSRETPTLLDFVAALSVDDAGAIRVIRASPGLASARVVVEKFSDEIGHQLYAGDTALHMAAAATRPHIVKALIDAGGDVNAQNRRRATPLHYACDPRPNASRAWSSTDQRMVIELLLDAGANIELMERSGAVPLHRAVRARSPEAVRCLLERGARVDARHGGQESTPLDMVMRSNGASGTRGTRAEQQEIRALLLEYGA